MILGVLSNTTRKHSERIAMCVIRSTHHLACGHHAQDVDAMVHSRCDAVSAALFFYHDQPYWQPLGEPLTLPKTCEAVYPSPDGILAPEILADQTYWDQWMRDQFEMNGFGALERQQMATKALGPLQKSNANVKTPYPVNQFRQYHVLIRYQARANKAPNVEFTAVPWACRRCVHEAAERMRRARGEQRP